MACKNRIFLEGTELLTALSNTNTPIKIRDVSGNTVQDSAGKDVYLTPTQAIAYIRSGVYIGVANKRATRVYYIKERDPRPAYLWERNYTYWDGRAVLRYAPDYTTKPNKVKNKQSVTLWNKMLQMDPPPKSWRKRP